MAKGNRDVELIIRAKNEASKALDSISASLDTLTKAQADVARGSTKTGGLLSQLGTELAKLNQQIGGMSTMDKLTRSMEKAAGSVARLESSITELNAEQQKLAADTRTTETALGALNAKAQQLKTTLGQQGAAANKAEVELSALNAEVKSGESSLSKSVTNTRNYETQLQKLESKLAATRAKHRELTQEILNAENPSQRLIASFERTDKALEKQAAALTKAQAAYSGSRAATAEMEQSLVRLRSAQAQTAASFEQSKAAQTSTAATLKQVTVAVREAEKNLQGLQDAAAGNAAALERQDKALQQSRVELAAVEQAAREADVALDKIGGTVRQKLLRSLADSSAELKKYEQTWREATAAVRNAVANGASVKAPTAELTQNIAVAQASKQAYLELQTALQQMRTAVRDAGTDVTKLSSAQQTFVSALDRVKAKTNEVSAAQQALANNAQQAGNAVVNTSARQAAGYQQVTSSVQRMGSATKQAAGAMDELEVRGRRALSWGQRLNSEMIALATSFVGVYAGIQQLQGVTKTFLDMEAVASRLGVAFNGNAEVIGREMRWLQSEADRLGIDIRVLATEYSKLAIATNGSALQGEATRKIFLSLAEAFRVNKLSSAQMELAFNAVTQMVNKGSVSMEELRQQLGERLAGAFNQAAKSMGLTTKEFGKLVAEGKLATDEFLPKFAKQLDETFGPQLPKSLESLTTEIGQFQNELTKAQMRVAEGGFIEGLRVALESLTKYFQSDEGQRFFENLGAAAGGAVKVLAAIPQYLDLIAVAAGIFVGRKLTGYVLELSTRFTAFAYAMKPLPAAIAATTSSVNAFSGVGGVYNATTLTAANNTRTLGSAVALLGTQMRASVAGLTAASAATSVLAGSMRVLQGALALVGGVPGLIITGLTTAFTYWLTSTDEVIDATGQHEQQMQRLLDLYRQTSGQAGKFAEEAKKAVSLDQVETNFNTQLEGLRKASDKAKQYAENIVYAFERERGRGFSEVEKQVVDLVKSMRDGQITARDYRDSLANLLANNDLPERLRKFILQATELNKEFVASEDRTLEAAAAMRALGLDVSALPPQLQKAIKSLDELAKSGEESGQTLEQKLVDPADKFAEALDALRNKVPSLTDELKLLEQIKAIDEILKTADAIQGIDKTSAAYQRLVATAKQAAAELRLAFDEKQFKDSYNLLANGGTAIEQSAALLRKREGFQATAKWDVNAFRAGFGSDTVTLADGSVQKVVEGMRVSVADANRDLVRRIGEFQGVIKNQIGAERFASFNPQQQAVLTSVAYNYGSLPERILDAVRKGSSEEIAAAIRGLAGDNNGINSGRRNEEAYLFQTADKSNAEATTKMVDDELKATEQLKQKADQYHERLADTLDLKRQESELAKQRTLQEEINLAISKAENDAKKAGTVLSEAEKQKITEITTNLYERKAAEDAITQSKKDQEAAEQRINLLSQTRRDLLEQMRFAMETGNYETFEALKAQFSSVDEQLKLAIDSMIKFWEASADPEKAAAAIASLNTLKNSLGQVNQSAILTAFNVGKAFGDQLIAGANNFLAKIRETGDVINSAKEAFRQFASDFLLQIAQMILKQAILNALQAAMGAGGGGGIGAGILSAFGVGVQHNGGVTGSGNRQRSVSPAWFTNATRYHSGGIAGLKPNEVPTILEKGEEVLPATDPRHVNNGGGGVSQEVKIVNAIDAGSFVSAGVEDTAGQKAILNFMRANSGAVKGALGM